MLVLTRRVGEQIQVGDQVVLTVVRISDTSVRIGIEAPPAVTILRGELAEPGPRLPMDSAPVIPSQEVTG